jgi:hypothetical protein
MTDLILYTTEDGRSQIELRMHSKPNSHGAQRND